MFTLLLFLHYYSQKKHRFFFKCRAKKGCWLLQTPLNLICSSMQRSLKAQTCLFFSVQSSLYLVFLHTYSQCLRFSLTFWSCISEWLSGWKLNIISVRMEISNWQILLWIPTQSACWWLSLLRKTGQFLMFTLPDYTTKSIHSFVPVRLDT